jgi:succinate dehydrogenase / fumarate reductase flavoprotein subunit
MTLRNMFIVSEAIARSALLRRESRGAHFREDFPGPDPAQAKFNLCIASDSNGAMQVRQETIPEMRSDLRQVIEEMK